MQNTNLILVVGATGALGGEISRQLIQAGKHIRTLVRPSADRNKRAALSALGAELASGDLKHPDSLVPLCAGVHTVVSTASSTLSRQPGDSIKSVDEDGQLALVEAAVAANVRHFVFVSVPEVETGYSLLRAKRRVEMAIRESPMSWTILRPTNFIEAWLSPQLGFDPLHGRARVLGSGEKTVSWISLHDVARFTVAATDGGRLTNRTIDLGGPEALSYHQVLAIFRELGGPPVEIEHVPERILEAQLMDAKTPLDEAFAAIMLGTARGLCVEPDEALSLLPGKLANVREYAIRMLKEHNLEPKEDPSL